MEEIFSLPPIEDFFNNDYTLVLEFMDTLGNPKFKIAGNVDLSNSDIESLGNLVEVEGNLELFGSNIQFLPENLHVGGVLDIRLTDISELPDNLTIKKVLEMAYTEVSTIPNNLKVLGGYLDIRNTPLTKKFNRQEIHNMIIEKGGYVNTIIYAD